MRQVNNNVKGANVNTVLLLIVLPLCVFNSKQMFDINERIAKVEQRQEDAKHIALEQPATEREPLGGVLFFEDDRPSQFLSLEEIEASMDPAKFAEFMSRKAC
jgi:hypothetical protein